ncbi:MAG: YgfZ/GcvT domain-containing protein [Beijerinckiaceae bacterium]
MAPSRHNAGAALALAIFERRAFAQAEDFRTMGSSLLSDRGVVKVAGSDAESFLHRLVTNSVLAILPGEARYAGLLTPQGKLIFDFLVVPLPEGAAAGFYLDCSKEQAPELAQRLNFHKLRAKIDVEDLSAALAVAGFWNEAPPQGFAGTIYTDPRAPGLGSRVIAPHAALAEIAAADEGAYEAHRIALGVAKGGVDFLYGDTFVHDANMDLSHGVDFEKGCYVGQEVVARVHHRRSARKRIVKIHFKGPVPETGTDILAGEASIGHIGSVSGSDGLAMLRLDRVEDAKAAGTAIRAGDAKVEIIIPPEFLAGAAGAG